MDKKDALLMVKMMFQSKQMKEAKTPETPEEETKIIEEYDTKFPQRIFKMTRMDWSCRPAGMSFSKDWETWIVDVQGKMGYYAKYGDGKISNLIEMSMKQESCDEFASLLRENFTNEVSDRDGADGEGWEMILYDGSGNTLHRICGYIYGNEYLNKIVEFLKKEHQLSQFM